MKTRTKPVQRLITADDRPIKVTRPRLATDPDALALDLADRVAMAQTTTDDRIVALGLDLAPMTGYCYALVTPGKAFDPRTDFTALGPIDLKGGAPDDQEI